MDVNNSSNNRVPLSWRVCFCYGVGHVLNDICASIWFTYLLVFFHLVLNFDPFNAGIILLVGQVADAIATPFVGIESDKYNGCWIFNYGKRKTWHLLGTLCILGSFPFIFTPCIGCRNAHVYAQMIYYCSFVIIFQFGWAAVQVSHLALIPEITPNDDQRTQLTSIRYSFTVVSTVLVYVMTWVSLKSGEDSDKSSQIGPNDAFNFQRVVYIGLLIGSVTSLLFHRQIKENTMSTYERETRNHKTVLQFMKDIQFYQVAITYMSSRLFVNIAQVYIPLYLHETLSKNSENVAVIPLLIYLGSIITSFVVNPLNSVFGRKVTYAIGSLLGVATCIWIKFGTYSENEIYPIAVLLGVSGSVLIVTALGLTADLIGTDTDTGAFVYGAMSFSDKLSNGIAVIIIQYLKCILRDHFYERVLVFACGGAALMGLLMISFIRPLGSKNNAETTVMVEEETKPLL